MNVLVIEDNEQNLYLLRYLLEHRGHQVAEAKDGPAGLALAEAGGYDLILLDIQLPGMDGHAVAGALRAHETSRHVPLVAVTSYAMADDRQKALEAGCDDYLAKPIDPITFGSRVETLVENLRNRTGLADR